MGLGLDGLFTVIGSLASVILGMTIGFQATLIVAAAIYAVAFGAFVVLQAAAREPMPGVAVPPLQWRDAEGRSSTLKWFVP